jgi:hypothetical protein
MEQIIPLLFAVILAALVAILGKNRKIGYGWSFIACLFLSPIIGLIIILISKKNKDNIEFIEIEKE